MEDRSEPGPPAHLSPDESARLIGQVAELARAGLPLGTGFRALAEEQRGPARRALLELAAAVERGEPWETALEQRRSLFPPHLRGLIAAGVASGHLGELLQRFSALADLGQDLKRSLWLNLAYPTLTIILAGTLFLYVNVVLIAQFESIYRDFGVSLPVATVALIRFSSVLRETWSILPLVGGLILGCWLAARLFLDRPTRRSLAGRLPIVGGVWQSISWAEFCHLLGILLEAGRPLPEAMRLTGEGVANADLDRGCQILAQEIERGSTLASAMATRREFPRGLSRLLHWAQDQNATAEILHVVGELYEARARTQASFAGTVMAVLTVLLVLWGVSLVVPGLMLPLIRLISVLSG